jgi:hypothetical protein
VRRRDADVNCGLVGQKHQVRATLRETDRKQTVTAVATRLGVWELRQFAGEYGRHFEKLPSETLSAQAQCDSVASTWAHKTKCPAR